MYKPANIREFVTPAIFLKCKTEVINGRTSKTYEKAEKPNLRKVQTQRNESSDSERSRGDC